MGIVVVVTRWQVRDTIITNQVNDEMVKEFAKSLSRSFTLFWTPLPKLRSRVSSVARTDEYNSS